MFRYKGKKLRVSANPRALISIKGEEPLLGVGNISNLANDTLKNALTKPRKKLTCELDERDIRDIVKWHNKHINNLEYLKE